MKFQHPSPYGKYHFVITFLLLSLLTVLTSTVNAQPAANQPPAINRVSPQSIQEGQSISLPISYSDPDGNTLTLVISSDNPDIASASEVNANTLSIVGSRSGSATITLTVDDGQGGSASTSFTVTINPAPTVPPPNQAPVIGAMADLTLQAGQSVLIPISISDPDGNATTLAVASDNPSIANAAADNNTSLTIVGNGAGAAHIAVTVNDGLGGTASITFAVTVNGLPTATLMPTDAPTLTPMPTDIPATGVVVEPITATPVDGATLPATEIITLTPTDVGTLTGTIQPTDLPQPTATGTADVPMTSIIVRTAVGLTLDQQMQVITRNGGVETSSVSVLRLHFIDVPTARVNEIVMLYRSDSQVVSVELDKSREAQTLTTGSGIPTNRWQFPQAALAPNFLMQGSGSALAILDTGVNASLFNGSVLPGYSAFEGSDPLSDPNGHGTEMAGIALAAAQGANIQIMPVQVLDAEGNGQDSDIINGIVWATDNGASVILMAFSNPGYSSALQAAVDYAWSSNVILVAATGNDALSSATFPSGDVGVMGVSATDGNGGFASFSNYGADTFIAAPGINITTTSSNGGTTSATGTSASAASVAGAAAYMRALNPAYSNGVVIGKLARTTDAVGTQSQTGNGQINLARALSDSSTTPVKPLGVSMMGSGGPFVGPYKAATVSTATLAIKESTCTTVQSAFYTGSSVCASTSITTSGSGNNLRIQWYNPSGTLAQDTALSGVSNGVTLTDSLSLTSTFAVAGTWTVKTCATSTAGACSGTNTKSTQTFTVTTAIAPSVTVGAVVPNTNYLPTAGFVMSATGNSLTISMNVTNLGNGDDSVREVTITTVPSAAKSPLSFQVTGSSGSGGGVTWGTPTVTNNTSSTSVILFPYTGTLTTGTLTFTISLAAITAYSADQTDSFTATVERGTGGITAALSAANSLKRYSLQITDITPPSTSATVGQTVSPVLTFTNYSTASVTLTSANTGISGSAFNTTGTEGSFSSTNTNKSSSVTYTSATITGTGGSKTVEGDAGKGTTITAPHFSKTITVNPAALTLTLTGDTPSPSTVGQAYAVTFTYAVTSPGGGTPTGSVTVTDGTDTCTGTIASGTCNLTSTTAGIKSLTATYVNDGNYTGSTTAGRSHTVNKGTPTITWAAPSAITYGTALSATQLNATASVPGTFVYTPAVGAVLNAGGSQTLHVDFTPTSTANYNTASKDVIITVNKAALTITADDQTNQYGTALPTLTASYSGFVNSDTVASLDTAVSLTTTATSASSIGTYPITASAAADVNYTVTFVAGTMTVTKREIVITINSSVPNPSVVGQAYVVSWTTSIPESGSGTPGGTVTVSDGSVNCNAAISTGSCSFTSTSAGAKTLTATYSNDANFTTSSASTSSHTVDKATPTITWAAPSAITYGTALSATQLNATASVAGTFVYTPASGAVLNAGSGQTLHVDFTPTDATNYNAASKDVSITVNKAAATITWAAPSAITYGTALSATQLNATASVPGTFVYTPAVGAVLNAGSGQTLHVDFTPTSANYTTASKDVSLTVNKAALTITADDQTNQYGTALPTLTASYSGFVNGDTVVSLDTAVNLTTMATVTSSIGTYPISVSAASDANYTVTFVAGTMTVTKREIVITIDSGVPNPSVVGQAYVISWTTSITETGTGTPDGTVTVSDGSASCNAAIATGSCSLTSTTAGSKTLTATYSNDANFTTTSPSISTQTVNKATPTITWAAPSAITYGTALSAVQLNATASVAGTFVYTPASGTVLNADSGQTLHVDFTPTDATNYNAASKDVTVDVVKADTVTVIFNAQPSVSTVGQTYAVTWQVSRAEAGAGTPFGTVTISDGTDSCTASVDSGTCDLTSTTAGTKALTATYSGDSNFNGSLSTSHTHTVDKATPTLNWENPAAITYGTALSAAQLNATASVPGTFVYIPAAGTFLAAGRGQTLHVDFTPTDTANYATVSKDVSINIESSNIAISIQRAEPDASVVGQSYKVTWVISTTGSGTPTGTVTVSDATDSCSAAVEVGSCNLVSTTTGMKLLLAFYSGDSGFDSSLSTIHLHKVDPATPTITWSNPADITHGILLSSSQLNATASVPGTLIYTPAVGTLLNAGDGQTLHVDFTPSDAVNYLAVSKDVTINVKVSDTSIELTNDVSIPTLVGDAYTVHWTLSVTAAGSSIPSGTVTVSDGTDSCSANIVSGQCQLTSTTIGTKTLIATYSGDVNFEGSTSSEHSHVVNPITPTINWANPATINYGTALSAEQLNASISTPGTLVYTPALGTVLNAGDGQTLHVDFTPTDTVNYVSVSRDVTINVSKAALTVTADNQTVVYGEALPTFTVAYSGFVNGDSAASLDAPVSVNTSATTVSNAGSYPIEVSGAADANYAVNFVQGVLTITPLTITVSADNQTKVYGESDPAFTYHYSPELLNAAAFTGKLSRDAGKNVGSYAITQGTLALNLNYNLVFVPGVLEIKPLGVAVNASAQSKVYGEVDPLLTYTYSPELVSGDSFTGELVRAAGENAGQYAIAQGTLALSSNYILSYSSDSLTIDPLTINVTAGKQTKTYGEADPALTYHFSPELLGSDTFTGTLSRSAGETVGSYTINQGTLALSPNYSLNYISNRLTIHSLAITVTANQLTKTYGEADPALTYTFSPALVGNDAFTGTLSRSVGEEVGSYAIEQGTLTPGSNYDVTYQSAHLTIDPLTITVTADQLSQTYGDANPALTYTYSPALIAGDVFSGALSRAAGNDVGGYAIMQGTLAIGPNYTLNYVSSDLTISPLAITVTADQLSKIYGDIDPALSYSFTPELVSGDSFSGALTRAAGTDVGSYAIEQGSLALNRNYTLNYVSNNLTINPLTVSVVADKHSKTYGEADPSLTYTYVPELVSGDAFSGDLTRAVGNDVGSYAIEQGTLVLGSNYNLNYISNDLVVNPLAISVTANPQSKTYGEADPTLSYTFSPALTAGDSFSGALSRAAGSDVGSYAIEQGTLVLNGNYSINYSASDLTINPLTISVTADTQTKLYGQTEPTLSYTFSPALIVGDAFSGALSRVAGNNVGSYAIEQGTLALSSNYTLNYTASDLTINPLTVTVTADAKTKTYGEADPALTYSFSPELMSGDSFSGDLSRAAGNDVGSYAIEKGTLALNGNYTINYTASDLTINPLTVSVVADKHSKIYGQVDPALTYMYSPQLVSGDTFSGSLTRAVGNDVGSYAIEQGTLALGSNYNLNYTSNDLIVNPLVISVTAEKQSKTYGESDPTLSYTFSPALIAGDVFSGALSRAAGNDVGSYAIEQGTLSLSSNYNLNYTSNDLVVNPLVISVTAEKQSKTYGEADPTLSYTFSPALIVSDSFSGALSRAAGNDVGNYAIEQGTLSLSHNYSLEYVGADLTINPLTISVTADTQTKTYGEADPTFSYSYSPELVSSDSFSGTLSRTAGNNVGSYAIEQGTLALSSNYTLNYTASDLTINPLTVTVTADAKTKTYGEADPTLSYTFSPALIAGDTFSGALSRAAGNDVGGYAIESGTLALNSNYEVNYISNNLVIAPLNVTVTVDAKTKMQRESDPQLTYTFSPALINSDTFSGQLERTTGEAVGSYAITQGTLVLGSNYNLDYVGNDLTILFQAYNTTVTLTNDPSETSKVGQAYSVKWTVTAAEATSMAPTGTVTVTDGSQSCSASIEVGSCDLTSTTIGTKSLFATYSGDSDFDTSQSSSLSHIVEKATPILNWNTPAAITYGTALSASALNATVSIPGTLVYTPALGTVLNAGKAQTLHVEFTPSDTANYNTLSQDVLIDVDKAALTITATDQSKVYGDALPELTVTYSGFVNTDTIDSLDTPVTVTTSATDVSHVGTYPIEVSGAADANYDVTFVPANLTVTPLAITVSAAAQSKTYADADPTLTYTYSPELLNGDTFSGELARAAGEDVGSYAIAQGTVALSDNYTLNFVSAKLTINPLTVSVVADAQSKTYGDSDPALTYTYSPELLNGDSFSGALARTAGEDVGTHAIYHGTLALSDNYSLNFVGADLTISPLNVLVAPDAQSKTYGDSDPALTYTYSPELVNGDTFSGSLTRDAGENVGNYNINQGTLSLSDNYILNYAGDSLTIDQLTVTVSAISQTKPYGSIGLKLTYSYSPELIAGDTFSGDLERTAGEDVGSYDINQGTLSLSDNYILNYVGGSLTIDPLTITVSAVPQTKTYGNSDPNLTYVYSPELIVGDAFSGDLERTTGEDVGSYAINQGTLELSSNYTLNYVSHNLTVTKALLTVTADNQSRPYGDSNPNLTVSYAGFINGDTFASSVTGSPLVTTTATPLSLAGNSPYAINVGAGTLASGKYNFTFVNGVLTILKVAVTANNQTRVFGDANPTLSVSYSNLKTGQTFATSGITGSPTCTTTATTASPAGSYPINCTIGTLASSNYSFAFVGGTLTINKAPITITASSMSRVYGTTNPTFTVSYTGFKNAQTLATSGITGSPSVTTTATETSAGSSMYPITPAAGTLVSNNYSFTFVNGLLTITKAPLTVTSEAKTRLFGDANPPLTVAYTNFKNGETLATSDITGQPTCTTLATSASSVGIYTITCSVGTLASRNYSFTVTNLGLTVTKAPLTVTVANTSRVYGAANPTFAASYSGFKNGQTLATSGVTGSPTMTTTATLLSPASTTYPITVSLGTLVSSNYSLVLANGSLSITKAPLTMTVANATRVFGTANPTFTVTYTGFKNSQTLATSGINGSPVITTTATTTSPVSTTPYPITAAVGTLVSSNYSFVPFNGALTITKAALNVTADAKTRLYGDVNPAFTVSYGFTNGVTLATSGITGNPACTTTATVSSVVGSYPITCTIGTLVSGNYTITMVKSSMSVTKAPLTITAVNKTRLVGAANPAFTVTYSGFKNGQTITTSGVTGAPACTTTALTTSPAGIYPISCAVGTMVSANYSFNFVAGTLLVQ